MDLENRALNTFADWVETKNSRHRTFKEWQTEFLPEYSSRCHDICKNIYIMKQCLHIFEKTLKEDIEWKEAFSSELLWQKNRELCFSMEIAPNEFFDKGTRKAYAKKCFAIWKRYFDDDE